MKRFLILLTIMLGFASAIDMSSGSEQFYVVEGLFGELNINRAACPIQDDFINFACGTYGGSPQSFQQHLDIYIKTNLPGLRLNTDWFDNAGALVRDYVSNQGRYFFTYSPNGYIVVAFIPSQ